MTNSTNPAIPHHEPAQPDANSFSPTSQAIASSHPAQPASTPGESRQTQRHEAMKAKLRSQYPELRRYYLASQEGARICGWGSPWPDRKLANLDLLFAEKAGGQSPESPSAEIDASASRCSFGKSAACLYSLPSLDNHRATPPVQLPARLTFDRYEHQQYYPNLEDGPSPRAITFRELHWWLTDPHSPLRAETKAIAQELPTLMRGGYEPFFLPSSCFVAFGSSGAAECGEASASGLGVIHFAVDPTRFKGQVRQAFLNEAFCGISPPLLLNRWPSRRGMTAVVVLPSGPEGYAKKIEDLVVHFNLHGRYRGLRCHHWQNQDQNRPTTLYWDANPCIRPDLLG